MNSGIYCIINLLNGMRYIGQAKNLKKRKREHFNHYNSNIYLQNAMKKYGVENFEWNILELCSLDIINEREQFYIDSFGFKTLYNLRPNVETTQGLCKVPVLQICLKTATIVKRWDSLRLAAEAMNVNDSTISSVCSQTPIFDKKSGKYFIRKSACGYFWKYADSDSEIIVPLQNANVEQSKKSVAQIDLKSNKILKIYDSITEAAFQTKGNQSRIGNVCTKQNGSSGGFKWRFTNELTINEINSCLNINQNELLSTITQKTTSKLIYGINKITGKEYFFNNPIEASKELRINNSHIISVANGRRKLAGGIEWYYAYV